MKKDTVINIEYGAAQWLYWMAYASGISFTAVYLQSLGFSNTGVGIVFGLGYVLGFFGSNILGTWIDRFEKVTAPGVITVSLGIGAALMVYLMCFGSNGVCTVLAYGLFICVYMCIGGVLTKQWADLIHSGYRVNYGITRAAGSLGYALMAALAGVIVEKWGVGLIFPITLGTIILEETVNILLQRKVNAIPGESKNFVKGDSLFGFMRKNGLFCLLLFGVMLLFTAYRLPNDYMINVVTAIGGNAAGMGAVHAFNAMVEIPTMVIYSRIGKKLSAKVLMTVSVIGFTLKIFGQAMATSMFWLFVATLAQSIGYALYTPAIVDYIDRHIAYKDSAKGQLMANGVMVLGAVVSSLLGGALMDRIPVKSSLLVALAVSAVGTAVCVAAVFAMEKQRSSGEEA